MSLSSFLLAQWDMTYRKPHKERTTSTEQLYSAKLFGSGGALGALFWWKMRGIG